MAFERKSGEACKLWYSWQLPALSHWELKVGGTRGSEEVRSVELAEPLPAVALNLCLGCLVICSCNLALDGWRPLCVKGPQWPAVRMQCCLRLAGKLHGGNQDAVDEAPKPLAGERRSQLGPGSLR